MKYLIVDDNPEIRKLISQTVLVDGDKYCECSDGSEAFEAYAGMRPDYVLMDVQMKSMSGIEVSKKMISLFPEAKIIIITDYDSPSFRQAAMKAGAVAFFSKEDIIAIKDYINNGLPG